MSDKIRVANFINDSITDGPGLRFTLFVQGCTHCCKGCHNPSTWALDGGSLMSPEEIFNEFKDNILLSGVTFSGGEPFLQAKELLPLAKMIKDSGLELAIYSGFTYQEIIDDPVKKELLSFADTLIDGRFELENRSLCLKFKGSTNQRIIDVKSSLSKGEVVLETGERWS
ncbi:MAG: anaerobic ribonucleoside-triphosphate reductase activating protein [Ruminococcaceae bacterium]|nr:anaerobic ribonucleoside-triphosphate reductase activating protein [Oscillospiraceae bacterium]